jgi:ornithine decarboxylase
LASKRRHVSSPLSRKFGCEPEFATDILELAHNRGLIAHGISFHVGSQQHNVEAWDRALASAATIFRGCAERGINLAMVNLGGGFPARYVRKTPKLESYGKAIFRALRRHFGKPSRRPSWSLAAASSATPA